MRYLKLAFQAFIGEAAADELYSTVSPAYCFSHFSKNWSELIKRELPGDHMQATRRKIRALLSNLTTIADARVLEASVKNIIRLLGSEFDSDLIQSIAFGVNVDDVAPSQEARTVDTTNSKAMYANSPFYQLFNKFAVDEAAEQLDEGDPNDFYCPTLLDHLLKHYFAYLPWWTIYIASSQEKSARRSNNARVERHFRDIKDTCAEYRAKICRLGSIRVGRYIATRDEMVRADLKIVEADEARRQRPKPAPEQHQPDELDLSQRRETWSKGRRRIQTDAVG